MFTLSYLTSLHQGRQDSVVPSIKWISPELLNHGISTGRPACVLEEGESNLDYFTDDEKLKALVAKVNANQVSWHHPEETAILHIMCKAERGEDVSELLRTVASLETHHRIRFFPRDGESDVGHRYALVSEISHKTLVKIVMGKIDRANKYVQKLKTILANYLRRKGEKVYSNPDAETEGSRLKTKIISARSYLQSLSSALNLVPSTGVDDDILTMLQSTPELYRIFARARKVQLKDLGHLDVQDWATRVADYCGIAGSPTLAGASDFEQKISDILFLLSERVAKSYLVGTDHQRISRTSFPWHFAAAPDWSAKYEVRSRVREILTWFVELYPGHVMPNPLVQAIQALLKSSGDEKDIIPLKTIAEDLFRWGDCTLSRRYHYAAKNALPLLSGYYAKVYNIKPEALAIIARGIDEIKVKELEAQIEALRLRRAEWTQVNSLRVVLNKIQSPLSNAVRLMVDNIEYTTHVVYTQSTTEDLLNALHVLTVPLLPAIRLGAISDYEAYSRGAWANIRRRWSTSDPRTVRRLGPMIANMHMALSFVSYRGELIAEFRVEDPRVAEVVFE